MYLKQLTLKNFQKHSDLTLNFDKGVNILYGQSDSGKSNIRRAIAWLYDLQSYNEETIRKEGSKKTSVIGLFDNGIEIERVRSSSINRYVTRVPGQKEMEYDAVGKGAPEEVRKLINMSLIEIDDKIKLNLNIAEQISMPFLSDISGSARLKLFNQLTGNNLIDQLVQNFNKEIINIRRNLTIQENIITVNQPEIEKLDVIIKDKKSVVEIIQQKLQSINENYKKLHDLTILNGKTKEINLNIANVIVQLNDIKIGDISRIASLKVQNEVLNGLIILKKGINSCSEQLDQVRGQLAQIKAPTLNSEAIRGNIERLNRLKSLFDQINAKKSIIKTNFDDLNSIKDVKIDINISKDKINLITKLVDISSKLVDNKKKRDSCITEHVKLQQIIPNLEQEYQEILKEMKICPLCKQDTSKCEVHI